MPFHDWLTVNAAIPGYAVETFARDWLSLRRVAVGTDLAQCCDRRSQRVRRLAPSARPAPQSPVPCLPPFAARVG